MVMVRSITLAGAGVAIASLATLASAHIALWHPSMFGFNVTAQTFSYDNRPVTPLMNMDFQQWWFHGFLDYPPNAGDLFELPAGGTATTQLACDKGATDYFASSQGGDIRQGNWPCPGQPSTQFHTNSISDVAGCALAITYKSNQYDVQPEDFTVFSTNPTCVWTRYTDFEVPAAMPACPEEGCICSWFWIHSPDSGAEQNYMSPFRCKVTGATGTAPVAQAQLPRRCGADPANGRPNATPSNCTVGAKQPFYWFQKERNNMFEGTYSPPLYNKLYGYEGGAENNIFDNSGSQPAQVVSSAPAKIASSSSSVKTTATLQATTSAVVAQAKPTSVASAQSEVHTSSSAPQAHSTSVAEAHSTSVAETHSSSVTEVHSSSIAEAHSSSVAEVHSSSVAEAHSSSVAEAHSSSTVEAHSTTASHSASTASSGTASSASATSTRRCKSRKSKRSALEASADTKRAISPHARHHNLGRYVHDSTLH